MTQDSGGRAPRTASTLDAQARRARYLQALAGLSPHHAHDLRGRLGSVALHLDVAAELLSADGETAPAAATRARAEVGRARTGLREVLDAFEALLGLTRSSPAGAQRFDLRELLRDLETVLAPAVRDRKLEWSAVMPEQPAYVAGEHEALRQALIIAAVEMVVGLPPASRLELLLSTPRDRVELSIAGVSAHGKPVATRAAADDSDPLEILRQTMLSSGGAARGDGATRLVLTLPSAPASR